MKILCGIITYNPNIKRLKENIGAVFNQVDYVLIFDNGSKNFRQINDCIIMYDNASAYENAANSGIAHALNYIMDYAVSNGYDWVLSLDQDTVIYDKLIHNYIKYLYIDKIGALTCNYIDRNTKELEFVLSEKPVEVLGGISSGLFMSVSAFTDTAGYDEKMFIDNVDYDICNALRLSGYRIVRIPYVGFLHELGNSRIIKIGRKKIKITNHSSFRRYYIFRNTIYIARKYPDYYNLHKEVVSRIKDLVIIIIFEDEKFSKVHSAIKGIYDGFNMEL